MILVLDMTLLQQKCNSIPRFQPKTSHTNRHAEYMQATEEVNICANTSMPVCTIYHENTAARLCREEETGNGQTYQGGKFQVEGKTKSSRWPSDSSSITNFSRETIHLYILAQHFKWHDHLYDHGFQLERITQLQSMKKRDKPPLQTDSHNKIRNPEPSLTLFMWSWDIP